MDRARTHLSTETNMLVIIRRINFMERANLLTKMEIIMKENGKWAKNMAWEQKHLEEKQNTQGNSKMESIMAKELKSIKMDRSIAENIITD